MKEKFEISSSKGQVCIYGNYNCIYEGRKYVSLWELNLKTDFEYDIDNPFYIIRWTYNNQLIRLKIYGLATNFQVDPLSKFIVIQAKNIECERSYNSAYTINSSDDWHFCYFIENNGEVNHKLVLPEFVHYKDDIPWDTFLPNSMEQAMESRRQLVEGLFDIVFDDKRSSLVGKYYYMNDSVQEREYDAINREWGAIVSAWKS